MFATELTMMMLAEGKTNEQIMQDAGIQSGSIAAYKAWNTMYRDDPSPA